MNTTITTPRRTMSAAHKLAISMAHKRRWVQHNKDKKDHKDQRKASGGALLAQMERDPKNGQEQYLDLLAVQKLKEIVQQCHCPKCGQLNEPALRLMVAILAK